MTGNQEYIKDAIKYSGPPSLGPMGHFGVTADKNMNEFYGTANNIIDEYNKNIGSFKTYGEQVAYYKMMMERIDDLLKHGETQ